MNGRRIPTATYRVQFSPRFRFVDATVIVPYLHDLGISDLYTSPIFKARTGSLHGYDITDPTQLNPALGTETEFDALVAELHRHGMGLLLDIVPNHLAADPENPYWWDVLAHGRRSAYAGWFDIDWDVAADGGGRSGQIVLPVLGHDLDIAVDSGALRIERSGTESVLRYGDLKLPLSPRTDNSALEILAAGGSDSSLLRRVMGAQAYRLIHWRAGAAEVNYRRFFDINGLVGVRVEDAEVFEATHALVFQLIDQGKVTGLRVDHIDGLHDPEAYLHRLRARLPDGFYVVVEKILGAGERLPDSWPVDGTTGYDFLTKSTEVLVDREGFDDLDRTYTYLVGGRQSFADVVYARKREVLTTLFTGDVNRLARRLVILAARTEDTTRLSLSEDPARLPPSDDPTRLSLDDYARALVEVTACLPVYRTYVSERGLTPRDRAYLEAAVAEARRRASGGHATLEAIACVSRILLDTLPDGRGDEERRRFVMRWQQFTGTSTAKGIEDTAFFVHNRLIALNEVGGDHESIDHPTTPEEFRRFLQARAARWPQSLNATSTHDSKRSEDVRARIVALSRIPDEWRRRLERWRELNRPHLRDVNGLSVPDPPFESLIYQTLIGAWPLRPEEVPPFRDRLGAFLIKAAREAKTHTSWVDPDAAYERALLEFAGAILAPGEENLFLADFLEFEARIAGFGMSNSLALLLLKIASPGVPDFYQGTELWDLSLVDPDNRRPVDFEARAALLDSIRAADEHDPKDVGADTSAGWQDGRLKLLVTYRALRHRRADRESASAEGSPGFRDSEEQTARLIRGALNGVNPEDVRRIESLVRAAGSCAGDQPPAAGASPLPSA